MIEGDCQFRPITSIETFLNSGVARINSLIESDLKPVLVFKAGLSICHANVTRRPVGFVIGASMTRLGGGSSRRPSNVSTPFHRRLGYQIGRSQVP